MCAALGWFMARHRGGAEVVGRLGLCTALSFGAACGGVIDSSIDVDAGPTGGELDAAASLEARRRFEAEVLPMLVARCAACHERGRLGPPFMGQGAGAYEALFAWPGMIVLDAPGSSALLQKGSHLGPAWSADQARRIVAWIEQEARERSSTPAGVDADGVDAHGVDTTGRPPLVPDYGAALRSAKLRLLGELPNLAEIEGLARAADLRASYDDAIDAFVEDPRLARELVAFFREVFVIGGGDGEDSAPVFAAQLVVEGRDLRELFTADHGTCPTLEPDTREPDTREPDRREPDRWRFRAGDCGGGLPRHVGVLTNPALQARLHSHMAFRRARWVQETFACAPLPAEQRDVEGITEAAYPVDGYLAPWPLHSIAGASNGGRIDFLDTSSVICANCHSTLNHLAPLFAPFDARGRWRGSIAVSLPIPGEPMARHSDWLPGGEVTGWRFGVPARDLVELGEVLANDEEVHVCVISRLWAWAFHKPDLVDAGLVIPESITSEVVRVYLEAGFSLKAALRAIFKSDSYVRF